MLVIPSQVGSCEAGRGLVRQTSLGKKVLETSINGKMLSMEVYAYPAMAGSLK
jgi:hypothetical protein